MTDEEARALGLRLVACGGFRWMPGMLAVLPGLRPEDGPKRLHRLRGSDERGPFVSPEQSVADSTPSQWWHPDLRDAATRGCVLELVREKHGDTEMSCGVIGLNQEGKSVWAVCGEDEPLCMEATEAHALVVALEAAPFCATFNMSLADCTACAIAKTESQEPESA